MPILNMASLMANLAGASEPVSTMVRSAAAAITRALWGTGRHEECYQTAVDYLGFDIGDEWVVVADMEFTHADTDPFATEDAQPAE